MAKVVIAEVIESLPAREVNLTSEHSRHVWGYRESHQTWLRKGDRCEVAQTEDGRWLVRGQFGLWVSLSTDAAKKHLRSIGYGDQAAWDQALERLHTDIWR